MICWADPRDAATQTHVRGFWEFQRAFREAATKIKEGAFGAVFPPGAFRPGVLQPLSA